MFLLIFLISFFIFSYAFAGSSDNTFSYVIFIVFVFLFVTYIISKFSKKRKSDNDVEKNEDNYVSSSYIYDDYGSISSYEENNEKIIDSLDNTSDYNDSDTSSESDDSSSSDSSSDNCDSSDSYD